MKDTEEKLERIFIDELYESMVLCPGSRSGEISSFLSVDDFNHFVDDYTRARDELCAAIQKLDIRCDSVIDFFHVVTTGIRARIDALEKRLDRLTKIVNPPES